MKLKMSQNGQFFMFLISALPPEGAFQMSTHFYCLWPLRKKKDVQIFERRSGYVIIKVDLNRAKCARGSVFSVVFAP